MRLRIVALIFLSFFFSAAQSANAYYYDDSVIIEIGDGTPSETSSTPPSGDSGSSGTGGSGGGGGSNTQGNGTTGGSGNTNQGGGSSGGVGGIPGSSNTQNDPNPNDVLFDLLVAQGAIMPGSTNSSVNGNAGSLGGASNGTSGNEKTTINAAKVRSALRGKDSFKNILGDYSSGYRRGGYRMSSSQDLGFMAASAILEDANIDELSFGATKFELVYRSRGYLIGFIPKTFPLRIAVNPQASVATDRVVLTLPWYRFLLRKLFKPSALAEEIDALVKADVSQEGDTPYDVQARLFESLSFALQKKVGAITVNR